MAPGMTERPILFSGAMIRALLAGTKTQTRRLLKNQSILIDGGGRPFTQRWDKEEQINWRTDVKCPYGVPGDRLWVRERINRLREGLEVATAFGDRAVYAADGALTKLDTWPWKRNTLPGIHCPRGLSRIMLEVTDVRVQRLQDISEEDAKAEGVTPALRDPGGDCWTDGTHRTAYEFLWGQINGFPGESKRRASWDENPWVWAVSFRRLDAREIHPSAAPTTTAGGSDGSEEG